MKMQTLIVDDEALGRERLRLLLAKMPEFDIAGECHGGQEAVELIETLSPQIVLLDIQMPDLDGFGVIAELQRRGVQMPIIIFVTAYQEHAVKAFEVNAIDYLLKPVQGARLEAALDRARTQLAKDNPKDGQTRLANVVEQMQPKTTTYLHRIEVRSLQSVDYVKVADVVYLTADGNYIELHTGTKTYVARIAIADMEQQLDPDHFFRVSRSAIVRISSVRSIHSMGRSHQAVLFSGEKVPVTRALDDLHERLKFAHE